MVMVGTGFNRLDVKFCEAGHVDRAGDPWVRSAPVPGSKRLGGRGRQDIGPDHASTICRSESSVQREGSPSAPNPTAQSFYLSKSPLKKRHQIAIEGPAIRTFWPVSILDGGLQCIAFGDRYIYAGGHLPRMTRFAVGPVDVANRSAATSPRRNSRPTSKTKMAKSRRPMISAPVRAASVQILYPELLRG